MTTSIIELSELDRTQQLALAALIVETERKGKSPFDLADNEQDEILSTDLFQAIEKSSSTERAQVLQQLAASLATPATVQDEEDEEDEEEDEE